MFLCIFFLIAQIFQNGHKVTKKIFTYARAGNIIYNLRACFLKQHLHLPILFVILHSIMQETKKVPTELGTQNIGSLLLKYALPAIIAMTASSILNIVDCAFIGNGAGQDAIAGLATTLPFMNLAAAFGAMVGVGASSIISIRLGQRDYKTAQHVLGNTITLNIVISILFALLCWIFLDPMLDLFGAKSELTRMYASEYMQVLLLGNVITHCYLGLNSVIRSAGHPKLSMICTITAVCINTLLDWLFVIEWKTGIQGAAIATVIAQGVALAMELVILSRNNELLHLQRGIYSINLTIIRQILAIGLSPCLMNICSCLVVILINDGMFRYGGDAALGAYGIVNKVVFFFLMIVMGLNQGMQPIVGYNWGARQNSRVWRCLKYTIIGATIVTTLGFLIGETMPGVIVRMMGASGEMERIAIMGFRIDVMVFSLVGCQMVVSNFFQSIGHAGKSIFLSMSRQLLFLIPGLIILPEFYGLPGVWFAIPLSDTISIIFSVGMLVLLVRKTKRQEGNISVQAR